MFRTIIGQGDMNQSILATAIEAVASELVIQMADTPALVQEAQRLRHQVYCLERGYKPGLNGLEVDAYDAYSDHVVLRLAGSGTVIGTARLILPQAANPGDSFPLQGICPPELFAGLPFRSTAEISRFAMSKERGDLTAAAAGLSRLALVRGLVQLSQQQGVTHWCAVMERTLLRLLRASAIHFDHMGPVVEYYGLRQPASCDLAEMLSRMKREQREIWGFVTDHGAFSPRQAAPVLELRQRQAA